MGCALRMLVMFPASGLLRTLSQNISIPRCTDCSPQPLTPRAHVRRLKHQDNVKGWTSNESEFSFSRVQTHTWRAVWVSGWRQNAPRRIRLPPQYLTPHLLLGGYLSPFEHSQRSISTSDSRSPFSGKESSCSVTSLHQTHRQRGLNSCLTRSSTVGPIDLHVEAPQPILVTVHDLPQIYQKPKSDDLIATLEALSSNPSSFSQAPQAEGSDRAVGIDPSGVPGYLTSIVSSSLGWIEDEDTKEQIWNLASLRLSERSGRTAMPDVTRAFDVAPGLVINLHEPSLTGDNLGLKTWSSSLLLSKILPALHKSIPKDQRVLELGAGTGLLGISAACLWKADVLLTDLSEIIPNLENNLKLNHDMIDSHGGRVASRVLDWADSTDEPQQYTERFQVILAADPIYSSEHPQLLVNVICRWLALRPEARLVLGLPLRSLYDQDRKLLRHLLEDAGLQVLEEGTEAGYDDWYTSNGAAVEVECSWSVWQPVERQHWHGSPGRLSSSYWMRR